MILTKISDQKSIVPQFGSIVCCSPLRKYFAQCSGTTSTSSMSSSDSLNVNVVVCIISRFIIDVRGVVDLCRVADRLDLVLELMQSLIGFVWFVSLRTPSTHHSSVAVGPGGGWARWMGSAQPQSHRTEAAEAEAEAEQQPSVAFTSQ